MFVAHRQLLPGDVAEERPGFVGTRAVGGLGVSISRTVYAWLWSGREGWEACNAARTLALALTLTITLALTLTVTLALTLTP